MSAPSWQISGEYMETCNCDYLCPCIYTNPQGEVTHDHCTAALIFRIDKGQRGGTDLAGLAFALLIRSGKIMADGNWVFGGVVDDHADAAQRTALEGIVSGDVGGPPGMIRSNLVSDFRGVQFKPIAVKIEGLKRIYCQFARLAEPLDYKAIDGRPVDLVFLLLSPPDAGAEHLKALAAISRVTRHATTLEKMRGARSRDALAAVLMGADERDAA